MAAADRGRQRAAAPDAGQADGASTPADLSPSTAAHLAARSTGAAESPPADDAAQLTLF